MDSPISLLLTLADLRSSSILARPATLIRIYILGYSPHESASHGRIRSQEGFVLGTSQGGSITVRMTLLAPNKRIRSKE